jgi:glycosyltransferase involved in cell wall biosynthesis
MASGNLLLNSYPEFGCSSLVTMNTSLELEDFQLRADTCRRSPIRLVYVGNLVRVKSVDLIMRAVAALVDQDQDLELHLIGTGPERKNLQALCEQLSLQDKVVFHGYVADKTALLDRLFRYDIFVIASASEGFPRVIYEAMSQGLPVITTNVGGIPGFLEDGLTALLVQPNDVEALAVAIRRVIDDGDLRRYLICNGYDFAHGFIETDPLGQAFTAFKLEIEQMGASDEP